MGRSRTEKGLWISRAETKGEGGSSTGVGSTTREVCGSGGGEEVVGWRHSVAGNWIEGLTEVGRSSGTGGVLRRPGAEERGGGGLKPGLSVLGESDTNLPHGHN